MSNNSETAIDAEIKVSTISAGSALLYWNIVVLTTGTVLALIVGIVPILRQETTNTLTTIPERSTWICCSALCLWSRSYCCCGSHHCRCRICCCSCRRWCTWWCSSSCSGTCWAWFSSWTIPQTGVFVEIEHITGIACTASLLLDIIISSSWTCLACSGIEIPILR